MPRSTRPLALLAAAAVGASCLALAPAGVAIAAPTPEPTTGAGAPAAQEASAAAGLRINEVESSGGVPGDWIEFTNAGSAPADLSGYVVRDADDAHAYAIPAGTVVDPGAFLVLDELDKSGVGHFDFGLGKDDRVRLFDPAGLMVDEVAWGPHAATTYGRTDAGDLRETLEPTRGAANLFAEPTEPTEPGVAAALRLSEVDSQPADWVELVNTGATALDISGFELRDNSDDHSWRFPAGASIAPGEYLVVDENSEGVIGNVPGKFPEAIGIGSADQIRLFDPAGALLDDTGAWEGHAALDGDAAKATLARCEVGIGAFVLAHPTPGAPNACVTDGGGDNGGEGKAPTLQAWPGSPDVRVLDATQMFLEDSSGLDSQLTTDGEFLWAVDNGEGRFWKLAVQADGSVAFADGWADGKRARFQKDAADPRAAGPDTEGITVADDGFVYLASERDNSAKGVNFNVVLQVDPNAPGPDVVARTEWNLTALLPQVSANLGIEAVEWVSDRDLAGKLVDVNTGQGYDPATYPLHGNGLFFVAVEDGGQVFAFALNSDGTAQRVAEVKPGLAGVMALDYDTALGGLWAVCDDGCGGAAAFITLNGTAEPTVAHYARPEGLPNSNNEGFATAPTEKTAAVKLAAATPETRSAWWFTDGVKSGALHAGSLNVVAEESPGGENPGGENPGGENPGSENPGGEVSVPRAPEPTASTPSRLAHTGSPSTVQAAVLAALALTLAGGVAFAFARRRGVHTRTATLPVIGE